MAKQNHDRNYNDPSALTDYEKRILELKQQGLGWKDIADAIGNINARSVSVRFQIIKEKLAAQ